MGGPAAIICSTGGYGVAAANNACGGRKSDMSVTEARAVVRDEEYAFQRWVERTYARQERPLVFRAQTLDEWRQWQGALRAKVEELAGLSPPPDACDLSPQVLEMSEVADGAVIREKVVYQSEPDVWVPAWLLRPNGAEGR